MRPPPRPRHPGQGHRERRHPGRPRRCPPPQSRARFYRGLALARLGRFDEAERTAAELGEKAKLVPSDKEKRRHHHLLGEIALARGDTKAAADELERAASMLAPRGFPGPGGAPAHVPIWYSLASAHLAAGNERQAARWFERIAESAQEHSEWPIPYVRSFYFLGRIYEERGEGDRAPEHYRRFVEYWKDGDLDRERVKEAHGTL